MMLICPVREGENNPELLYAMRSWEANLHFPDGIELVTVGYKPAWLEPDHHIYGNRYTQITHAVWDNIALASHELRGQAEVVYMNDDFFCMDPMSSILPVRRNLTLDAHRALYPEQSNLWWARSLDLTASWLAEAGWVHPWSYEVHRPLLASPRGMCEALDQWDGGMDGDLPQWRTVYGVLNRVEAYPVGDVKLSDTVTGIGSPWISTSDASWRKWRGAIKQRFQKPSRWETA